MIFDSMTSGMGETLVAKELTRLGRKTGWVSSQTGCWKVSKSSSVKTIWGIQFTVSPIPITIWSKNGLGRDESEFVHVKGGFPQIISEEQHEWV